MAMKNQARAAAVAAAEQELADGRGELDAVERAAVRLGARLIYRIDNPAPGDDLLRLADALSRTAALLPARADAPWDLALLNDEQLRTLEQLACIATGQRPQEVKADAVAPERSRRHFRAIDLAAMLDRIEEKGGELQEIEQAQVCGLIEGLLYPSLPTLSALMAPFARAPAAASSEAVASNVVPLVPTRE